MKRFFPIFLCVLLLTSTITSPACASEELTPPQDEVFIDSSADPAEPLDTEPLPPAQTQSALQDDPDIHVTVPQSGQIILNPYRLPVETNDGTSQDQIVSESFTISNQGDQPVSVRASVQGSVANNSDIVYAPEPPQTYAQEKEIFLYAEFQNEENRWNESYNDEENQILISDSASEPQTVLQLDPGPSEGVFRLFGAAAAWPENPWSEDDQISVTVVFTFSPIADADSNQISNQEPPVADETPSAEEPPATDETPSAEEPPVADETPPAEEPPVADETPSAEEPPVADETPSTEEPPATDETPSAEEPPATDETPSAEEPPVADETPSAEEPPATDETPSTEEPPVTEEPPETGAKGDASLSACPFLLRPSANAQSLAA